MRGYHRAMSETGTVLEHLLTGRAALVEEVARLSTAIAELDAVISRVAGSASGGAATVREPVSAARPKAATSARSRSRRTGSRAARSAGGTKSIRVHVLEMLAEEDRDYGLTEIIDRIHGAGIKAHDDAVRSITTKLMKDGQVQRVARGQYQLTARPAAQQPADPMNGPHADPATYPPSLNLGQPWQQPVT
jgi:hypothetical protein